MPATVFKRFPCVFVLKFTCIIKMVTYMQLINKYFIIYLQKYSTDKYK